MFMFADITVIIKKSKVAVEFVIPVFEKLRQEDYCEFEASQDCVVKPWANDS